jgi:hypothetical protein
MKPVKHLLHVGYGFGFESSPEYPDNSRFKRNAYAIWLWRRDITAIPAETEMHDYSISINTAVDGVGQHGLQNRHGAHRRGFCKGAKGV